MKKFNKSFIFALLAVVLLATAVLGRANYENSQISPDSLSKMTSKGDDIELIFPTNRLPDIYGFQYTNEIATMYNCFGTFGSYVNGPYDSHFPENHYPSFMTPKDGYQEYLYVGSIWIGGIIGDDTLVSTGHDGWFSHNSEFWPPHDYYYKSVTESKSPADYSLHAEFYDTLYENNSIFWPTWPYHHPLNIEVALSSHTWFDTPNSQTIIYDMVITNIGEETINEGRVGLFFDSDVYDYNYGYTFNRHKDDISGSIREKGIVYTIDNDGDPIDGLFDEKSSPTRILAAKFIESSFEPQDTIFNWWISSGNTQLDFGPRLEGTEEDPFRDFYNLNLGTPVDDKDKYYLLSHPEWDYDQFYTATIDTGVHLWMEPNPDYASDFADGGDTRFLFSIGPVDIYPDSSIRVLFATFTGEDVHTVVNNLDNLPDNPDDYLANLNFTGVLKNADISDSLGQLLLNPLNPVNGLKVDYHDKDSAVIKWDPFVYDGVDGYEVYLSTVPFNELPYPGVIPPWLEPEGLIHHASLDEITQYTLTDICINKAYFVNVASRSDNEFGDPSKTVIIFDSTRALAPIIKRDYAFGLNGDEVTIEWDVINPGRIDHFNIYKFDSIGVGSYPFHAYYRDSWHPYLPLIDSFLINNKLYYYCAREIYDKIGKNARSFTDYAVNDGSAFVISSVNNDGFESEFSDPIVFHTHTPPTREILFITGNSGYADYRVDTVINFYNEILSGYDYDIIDYSRETIPTDCQGEYPTDCFDWRDFEPYKLLIMDSPINFDCLRAWAEENNQALTRYILSGGRFAYFGILYNISWSYETTFQNYNSSFIERFFGIDSIFNLPFSYYHDTYIPKPYIDTVSGFIKAESVISEAPDVDFDTLRNPFPDYVNDYWPRGTAPGSAAFVVNEKGQTTHLYRSKYPETSRAEGYPVGVKTVTDEATTYLYGFHLWYMEPDDARELINFITGNTPTDVDNSNQSIIPERFELSQNFPNPFNASTEIKYSLPSKSDMTLSIYNILGQRINLLIDEEKPAGNYSINWDGNDLNGRPTASGIYLYQIKAGDFIETKKMLLLK